MKLQHFASMNSSSVLKKYIKKAKKQTKQPIKLINQAKLYAKQLLQNKEKQGKFICANVKFIKTPENNADNVKKPQNIKFMIHEINSLSNFNMFLQNSVKIVDKPQIKEQIALVNQYI